MAKSDAERQAARRFRQKQQAEKALFLENQLDEEKARHAETRRALNEANRQNSVYKHDLEYKGRVETAELKAAWMRGVLDACTAMHDPWATAQALRNAYMSLDDCRSVALWYKDGVCVNSPSAVPNSFESVFDTSGKIKTEYLGPRRK